MPYQVSMMGWVGSGEDFCGLGRVGLGPEILGWVGLGFEKVTHDQLWLVMLFLNFQVFKLQHFINVYKHFICENLLRL